MKIRTLLSVSVLIVMLLGTALTGNRAECRSCPYYDWCVSNYNYCAAQCGGNQICLRICRDEYVVCQCVNCGLCPIEDPGDPAKAQAPSN